LHALQIQKVGICHKFPGKQALIWSVLYGGLV
jgi:hypothetical protein